MRQWLQEVQRGCPSAFFQLAYTTNTSSIRFPQHRLLLRAEGGKQRKELEHIMGVVLERDRCVRKNEINACPIGRTEKRVTRAVSLKCSKEMNQHAGNGNFNECLVQINQYRFMDLAWDSTNVRGQDYLTCLANIAANPVGEAIVWDYLRENWPKLVERFKSYEPYLSRLIPTVSATFASQARLDEMKAFFVKYPEAGAGARARKEALERIEFNIEWLRNNEQKVLDWVNGYVDSHP